MFTFFTAVVTGSPLGRIYATTNKPYYVAGELVQGNIVCEAKAPISASGIDLRVTGFEKTEWHDLKHRTETISPYVPAQHGRPAQAAQTRSIPVMHRHRGKKTFFNQNMRIYAIQGGMLAPGTYTFPFSYQLPEGIPGSFHERNPMPKIPAGCEWVDNDNNVHDDFGDSDDEADDGSEPLHRGRNGLLAVVHYKLKVTLDVNGFWMKDLFARIPIVVHPKLEVNLQPAMQSLTKEVVVCCCLGKGNCTVTARFDKLAYVAGETADVKCDIENSSSSDLKTRVILRRYLRLKSAHGAKNITEDVVQQQYDTVPENTKSMDRKMPLQLVGPKIKPSTTGNFVSCNYEYLVECGVSMGDDIHLRMPVTIYAPQPPPIDAPSSPAPPAVIVATQAPVMLSSPAPVAMQPAPLMVGMASPTVVTSSNSPQMQMGSPSYQQQPQQMQQQQPMQQQYPQQPQQQMQQQPQQYPPQQQMQQPQQYGSQPQQQYQQQPQQPYQQQQQYQQQPQQQYQQQPMQQQQPMMQQQQQQQYPPQQQMQQPQYGSQPQQHPQYGSQPQQYGSQPGFQQQPMQMQQQPMQMQ